VLIADDSRFHRQVMTDALVAAGYAAVVAEDGVEAARLALTDPPDLIILDIEMPAMNGYQVAHLLKDDPATAQVPLIFLTSKDQPGDRYWGLRLGAAHYLSKAAPRAYIWAARAAALRDAPARSADTAPGNMPESLMERLAGILDRRLFEAVVTSELAQLVDQSADYRMSLRQAVLALQRVADFDAAVLLMPDEGQLVAVVGHKCPKNVLTHAEALAWEALEGTCEEMPADLERTVSGRDRLGSARRTTITGEWAAALPGRDSALGALSLAFTQAGGLSETAAQALDRMLPTFTMVVDNLRLYEQMRLQAVTDGLTRAFNHRHFHELLKAESKRARRGERPLALLMIDLDCFKGINDHHGHQCGDRVLRAVADRIATQLRQSDVLARYGGEEFTVLLPDTDTKGAKKVAERIRAAVGSDPIEIASDEYRVTVSVGVAVAEGAHLEDPGRLIGRADEAMYEAKRRGRDRVAVDMAPPKVAAAKAARPSTS
jgi:two-component system cell cycle response regulator